MKHLYVTVFVPATVIIPLATGLIQKSYKNRKLEIIYWYLLFGGVMDVLERLLGIRDINNLPLLHLYTMAELLLLGRFFQIIFDNSSIRRLIGVVMIGFLVFAIVDLSFIQSIYRFNSYPRSVAALIISGFCLLYFFKRGDSDDSKSWVKYPLNWITTGLLLYFGSSFFFFAFLDVLYEKASLKVNLFFGTVHATLVMVMYLLFTVGFLYAKNQR
ncbi:hypothetical protein [Mucilaginibacter ginsenosidivorans]|uniref:Uncharacterized protein n=1 Tax=Mucilaginibacter ginsenosidivorans TaxID=398053 RepID=A0A5B8V1A1_9SPHI|nr:hypothetical protein [Mucilaginibacter ginsenosidivorans]QEC64805.1 hypothetical protein FRZ54_20290 [Mucilaginibacter ginsenosidivorans]